MSENNIIGFIIQSIFKADIAIYNILDDLYEENNRKCTLTFMKEPVPFFNMIIFNLEKNGPFTKAINEQ